MRAWIWWGLLGLLLRPAAAQARPDAAEILKKVNAAYKPTLNAAYEVDRTVTGRGDAAGDAGTFNIHLAFKLPDKFRLEMKGKLDPGGAPDIDELQLISNGSSAWEYSPKSHEYRTYTRDFPDSVNPEVVDDKLRPMAIWKDFLERSNTICPGRPHRF